MPEKCTDRNEADLFSYLKQRTLKNDKKKKKKDFYLSLFNKLLERRNLGMGIHCDSVILEPKRASIPKFLPANLL